MFESSLLQVPGSPSIFVKKKKERMVKGGKMMYRRAKGVKMVHTSCCPNKHHSCGKDPSAYWD